MERLLGSFFAEGVNVAVVRNDDHVIEGYAVYRLGQPEIPVTELAYTTRRAQRALLNYFYNHRSQGTSIRWNEGLHDTYYRFYPDGRTGHATMPYMMSRIVDVKAAFEANSCQSRGIDDAYNNDLCCKRWALQLERRSL